MTDDWNDQHREFWSNGDGAFVEEPLIMQDEELKAVILDARRGWMSLELITYLFSR